MLKICKFLFGLVCCGVLASAHAVDLYGVTSVNITSDTAANAKNIAFDEARRQIIADALRQYADADALGAAIKKAKSSELMNLISSSSIDGEKLSDTTYSANISMTLDSEAARNWLQASEIQNWLPTDGQHDVFEVSVKLSDPIADWIQLNKIARAEKIDLGTQSISGGMVTLKLPVSVRGKFTIAVREGGWRFANNEGVLRIWK